VIVVVQGATAPHKRLAFEFFESFFEVEKC
jgi:hypothetical protein